MKRTIALLLCMITIIVCAPFVFCADLSPDGELSEGITVYFLDVGQGDAAVAVCEDHAMMIDGGGSGKSDYIYSFLQQNGLDHLDYVVATHPGTDHIGGLAAVLNYAKADHVFCNYSDYDSSGFNNLKKYTEAQGKKIEIPAIGTELPLGSATVTVLGPYYSENNSSIVLKINYGNISFLFTGDSESNEEDALVRNCTDLKSTVLKIAHHGSSTSSTQEFLDAVSPAYAVISVGGDNSYGHPDASVLDRLYYAGTEVYRTDMHGIITMTSDGNAVQIRTEKEGLLPAVAVAGGYNTFLAKLVSEQNKVTESATAPQEGVKRSTVPQEETTENAEESEPETSYIVNINTGKFHYPDCSSVKKMKEANKWYYEGTRSYLISQGYSPCGNCHP